MIKNQNIDLDYTNLTKDGNEKILLSSEGNFDLNGNIDEFKYEYYFDKNKNNCISRPFQPNHGFHSPKA